MIHRIRLQSPRLRNLGVDHCALFGSFARDQDISLTSDVDVLVRFRAGSKTFDAFMELAAVLENALGRPVDLVTQEGLSRHLQTGVNAEIWNVPIDA